ncbi:hypothetical protein AAC387_Pa05g0502 [Persea americana]
MGSVNPSRWARPAGDSTRFFHSLSNSIFPVWKNGLHLLSSSSSVSISPQKTQSLSGYCPKSTISFSSSIRSSPTNAFCKRNKRLSSLVAFAGARHLTGSLTRTEGLRFAVVFHLAFHVQ